MGSVERILTTHVGSLPRPAALLALYRDRVPAEQLAPVLTRGVDDIVRQQRTAGIDIVNDGEYGKPATSAVDYGAWASYIYERLSGFEPRPLPPGTNVLAEILGDSKDRQDFPEFYLSMQAEMGEQTQPSHFPICVGPIRYTGHALIQRDIANLKAAVAAHGAKRAFMTAVVGGVTIFPGPHYGSVEAQSVAVAHAMREEYRAILDAGFDLQLDDPILVNQYEMHHSVNGDLAGFRKWAEAHIELVNEGLAGLPEDRIRYHVCWGSWSGPHSSDLPLATVLDLIVKVRAAQYSVEAANPQHEHEWEDWKRVKLPAGTKVLPGVVTHKTTVLEHPELIAQRLCRYADVVGRENVIASTDCGMGGRIHPTLAWAKLRVLAEGAERATRRLWPAALAILASGILLVALPVTGSAQNSALTVEQRLQRVEDELAIRRVLVDYSATQDARDYAGYAALFAKDGEWVNGKSVYKGREAIRKMLVDLYGAPPPGFVNGESYHISSNAQIDVNGDRATARSRHLLVMRGPKGEPTPALAGRYEDELIREDGKWKILRRVDYPVMPTSEEWTKFIRERRAVK